MTRQNMLPLFKLLLLSVATTTTLVKAAQYGLDCSFPIHNRTLSCGDLLGNRFAFYEEYIEGCAERYSKERCEREEDTRLAMSRRQPQSMVNYTSTGFKKIQAPESLKKLIFEFWEKNKDKKSLEVWSKGNIYTNHWKVPTHMVNVHDVNLEGGGKDLEAAILNAAKDAIEEWTTMKLRPSSLYGVRVYEDGAVLNPHVDRLPLVSSAIVNVAQDVDEPWPIEVYDRFDNAVNITMEPGDMVLYESGSLVHGRPFPLKGRFYANVFIHFEPADYADGKANENGLPPYIIPGSPEAEHWLEQHPGGWSKVFMEDDTSLVHLYSVQGKVDELRKMLEEEPHLVHYQDDNYWQPIHEAARHGQFEVLSLLIEKGADINARIGEDGVSVLRIALDHLEPYDPVVLKLFELGAEDTGRKFRAEYEEDYDYDYSKEEEDENWEEEEGSRDDEEEDENWEEEDYNRDEEEEEGNWDDEEEEEYDGDENYEVDESDGNVKADEDDIVDPCDGSSEEACIADKIENLEDGEEKLDSLQTQSGNAHADKENQTSHYVAEECSATLD